MNRAALMKLGLAAALVFLMAVAGCKGDTVDDAGEHAGTGHADVVLKTRPDPPVALKETDLVAEVRDAEGAPLEGAKVVFDLSMPGMYHGENRTAATEGGPGIYSANTIFTMGGKWLIKVEVKAEGIDVIREFYTVAEGG